MLLADRRNILEVWRKVFGDLEKKRGKIHWQFRGDVFGDFGEIMFGDFGENRSVIWRKLIRRFLAKTCSVI